MTQDTKIEPGYVHHLSDDLFTRVTDIAKGRAVIVGGIMMLERFLQHLSDMWIGSMQDWLWELIYSEFPEARDWACSLSVDSGTVTIRDELQHEYKFTLQPNLLAALVQPGVPSENQMADMLSDAFSGSGSADVPDHLKGMLAGLKAARTASEDAEDFDGLLQALDLARKAFEEAKDAQDKAEKDQDTPDEPVE